MLADLSRQAGEWLRGQGPAHDVVISSRVRLARNVLGMPFLSRCTPQQQTEIESRLRKQILESGIAPDLFYVDVTAASDLDRQLLVERHLISRQHALGIEPNHKGKPRPVASLRRGVAVAGHETVAIMVNEEDHLRIQVLRNGLQLEQAMEEIQRIDNTLEQRIDFAFHDRYGYLTACPTNVGTGLRVSAMLHLPALKMTREIEKAFRAARDMHLAIRGLYGEGTEAAGDFFQISNQTTLGKSEQQIVREFTENVLPEFIQYEQKARTGLLQSNRVGLEDKVCRAVAMLRSARQLGSDEAMYLLSLVRLGLNLQLVDEPNMAQVNELFLLIQPAHLQKVLGREMTASERNVARAEFVRKKLS